jgi:prepilin-type N-terminal cleavage/methylation domain-containing protein
MRAFTLIEVMVSTLVLSILVAGIYLVLNSGEMAYHTDMGLLALKQPTLRALDFMAREIREAKVATARNTVNANFDRLTFTTHNKSNVQYYCDSAPGFYDRNQDRVVNQLIREYPPFTYKILANNITRLKFRRPTVNLLSIQLQISKKVVGQRALSFSLQQEVRLRNE